MITCPRCHKQSPDGATCCEFCGFPGDKPLTRVTTSSVVSQESYQGNTDAYSMPPPVRESCEVKRSGFSGLIASVTQEFSTSIPEMIVFFIAMGIPILGLILTIKLGFGNDAPPLKKTFVRASLILGVAAAVLSILFLIIVTVTGIATVKSHFGW